VSVHRWLGICAGLLWLVQAVTGTIIVFHWEEDDATISTAHANTDFAAIGQTIARLAPAGSGREVTQVWTSAGFKDRYDIFVLDQASGGVSTVRVSGDGKPIRVTPAGGQSLMNTIVLLHQSLLGGTPGRWVIGASGFLLLSNLIFGSYLAWPRRGHWARALSPPATGGPLARTYGWHRSLGLIGVAPALVSVIAGILLAYNAPLSNLLGVAPSTLPPRPGTPRVGFSEAITTAQQCIPLAAFAAVELPTSEDATYKVHLRAPGEWRRAYGESMVSVDAVTGRVRNVTMARDAPPKLFWFNALAPTHTGEAFGIMGRLVVLCTGLWLATMIVLGGRLWWLRR
jgi:uncharacterized iron-regulated membrane protein